MKKLSAHTAYTLIRNSDFFHEYSQQILLTNLLQKTLNKLSLGNGSLCINIAVIFNLNMYFDIKYLLLRFFLTTVVIITINKYSNTMEPFTSTKY